MGNYKRKRARSQTRRDPGSNYWWPSWYRALKVMREREAKRERAQELADVCHG